jgi:hypothetical protein
MKESLPLLTMTKCRALKQALLGVSSTAFKSRLLRARRLLNQVQRNRVAPIRKAWSTSLVSEVSATISQEL